MFSIQRKIKNIPLRSGFVLGILFLIFFIAPSLAFADINSGLVGSTATTNFTDSGLAPATTYTYTVESYDAAGNTSARSAPTTVATKSKAPIVPVVLLTQTPIYPTPTNPTYPATAPTNATGATLTRVLFYGITGDDVRQLQVYLISKSYLAPTNDTGRFGPLTQAAVQAFQRANGIVSSGTPQSTGYGVMGPLTWRKIVSLGGFPSATMAPNTSTVSTASAPVRDFVGCTPALRLRQISQTLSLGSSGTDVLTLQCKLIKLGYLGSANSVGTFGAKTLQAVKSYQCSRFLVACKEGTVGFGSVGLKTRQSLNALK